jgi:hypothetical protein
LQVVHADMFHSNHARDGGRPTHLEAWIPSSMR